MSVLKVFKSEGLSKGNIIFVHGISSSSRVFNPVIDSSELSLYNKIVIDLPGHGRTIHLNEESEYSIANYKKVLLDSIRDIPDVLLVGNSLGGNLILEISNLVPGLKGIVLFATPPYKSPMNPGEAFIPNEALLYYLMEEVPKEALDSIWEVAIQNKDSISLIQEDFLSCDPRVRSVFGKELVSGGFTDEVKIFKDLHVPRYVFHGLQDPSVNGAYLRELCEASEGVAEFIPVDNCGHYVSMDQPGFLSLKLKEIADCVF